MGARKKRSRHFSFLLLIQKLESMARARVSSLTGPDAPKPRIELRAAGQDLVIDDELRAAAERDVVEGYVKKALAEFRGEVFAHVGQVVVQIRGARAEREGRLIRRDRRFEIARGLARRLRAARQARAKADGEDDDGVEEEAEAPLAERARLLRRRAALLPPRLGGDVEAHVLR